MHARAHQVTVKVAHVYTADRRYARTDGRTDASIYFKKRKKVRNSLVPNILRVLQSSKRKMAFRAFSFQ